MFIFFNKLCLSDAFGAVPDALGSVNTDNFFDVGNDALDSLDGIDLDGTFDDALNLPQETIVENGAEAAAAADALTDTAANDAPIDTLDETNLEDVINDAVDLADDAAGESGSKAVAFSAAFTALLFLLQ